MFVVKLNLHLVCINGGLSILRNLPLRISFLAVPKEAFAAESEQSSARWFSHICNKTE